MNCLNLHSHFSLMEGLNTPEELCIKAKSLGFNKLVLTDTNGLYGIPEFLKCAHTLGVEGIIGSEFRFEEVSFILIAKSRRGYEDLSSLVSFFHKERFSVRDILEFIKELHDLIVLSFDKSFLETLRSMKKRSVDLYFEMSPGFFGHADYLWAKKNGFECIANNKVHYIEKNKDKCFHLISAIKKNTTLCRLNIKHFHNENCFMFSKKQLYDYFSLYPDAIENNENLLDGVSSSWFYQGFISPGYNDLPEEVCDEKLKYKCSQKIKERYKGVDENTLKQVYERLDYEMRIISKKRFSSYFLNIEDIASQCAYTCGRGSSAASIVNYLLGITHVDPIRENLLFDRFMNLDRIDPPDIDVDFPSDQRDDVLDYIFEKFSGRAAMVSNHNYLRGRSAMREVAKVFGIKEDEISYTLDTLHRIEPSNGIWKKIIYYSKEIEGVIRHLSVHCGGVVITPGPITEYGPIEISKKGYPVLQWEKEQTEQAGLIKTDILGNKGLSVIRDVINNVNQNSTYKLDYSQLEAQKDEKTRRLFITGNTVGVIHFESPRCRTLLAAFKSAHLLTLSIVCSIIRPAAMVQVNEMLRRFHGGKFRYIHPELEQILNVTKGIMVYQEDVMRVSKALAGFSSQEGNELRKTLAKKHKNAKLNFYKEKFFLGCMKKGIEKIDVNLLWEDILSFSGYSFCKPHSDSYSLVAFKSAYLKAHYPAEFMSSILKNEGGFYIGDIEFYLNEARRMGVLILPPDINLSEINYEGHNNEIRVGLKQLKDITKKTLNTIIGERQLGGEFKSIENFLERSKISFKEAKIFCRARCFGSVRGFGDDKLKHSEIMWRVYQFFAKKNGSLGRDEFFPILSQDISEFTHAKLIQWELSSLNGFVTFPSWFLYKDLIKGRGLVAGNKIFEFENTEIILYGQKVSEKRVSTKYKEKMCFITFSDDTCMYNTTLFPKVYEECRDLLFLGGSFLIKGTVERDLDDFQVIVKEIERIGEI